MLTISPELRRELVVAAAKRYQRSSAAERRGSEGGGLSHAKGRSTSHPRCTPSVSSDAYVRRAGSS